MKIQNRVPLTHSLCSLFPKCFLYVLSVQIRPSFFVSFPLYYSFIDFIKYLASDCAIAKLKEKKQTTLRPLVLNTEIKQIVEVSDQRQTVVGEERMGLTVGSSPSFEGTLHLVPGPLSTHLMSISMRISVRLNGLFRGL